MKPKKRERRLDAELRYHFDRQVADNLRAGMAPEEARRDARLKFGGLEQLKEDCRDVRRMRWLETILQDVRFTLRLLRRSPGFSLVAVACLALGIGANAAIFSVMDALMLRLLPVEHPEQIMLFGEGRVVGVDDDFPRKAPDLFSQPFYREVSTNNAVFSDIAAVESMASDVHARFNAGATSAEPLKVRLVSANYFGFLDVRAAAGRLFSPEDTAVAVMRYGYWKRRFANDPSVIGSTLSFNGTAFTILGVAAPEFFGTEVGSPPDVWIPLAMQPRVQPWLDNPLRAETQSVWLMGRAKPGVTIADAQVNTNLRFHQWLHSVAGSSPSPEHLEAIRKVNVKLTEGARGISSLRQRFSRPLQILMVLVGLVLLIACANIANLLLARAAARQREMAVRLALGAQRRRLIVQLLSESLLLALLGGGLGLLVAVGGTHLLLNMVSAAPTPVPLEVGLDSRMLLFAFALSLSTGLFFGVVPALQMTRVDTGPSLKEGKGVARSRSHSRWGQMLVAGQVAVAFFLIAGAGLFVRTLQNLEQTSTGFEKDRVLRLQLDGDSSNLKGPALRNMYSRLEARIQALPGVQAASFSELAFNEGHWMAKLWLKGAPHTEANARQFSGNHVGAEYFKTMGLPIILGRGFSPHDALNSQPVAVVNETLARILSPHASPLGRQFSLSENDDNDFEIIGVVKDAKYQSIRESPRGAFFVFNNQNPSLDGFSDLVVRARRNPETLIGEIRAAIHSEDPNLAISNALTLSEVVDSSLAEQKVLAKLAGFFGILALLLAALGLYGVIAYSVARRANEIGIRMTLGARPSSIVRGVLRESLLLVGLGLAAGLPVALAGARLVASQLYEVTPADPWSIGTAAGALIVTALAASFLPARRAALLDPLITLREE
jgi:predicted permease